MQVLEYLSKKGYVRTEAMLRKESEPAATNGTSFPSAADQGGTKAIKAFELLRKYMDDILDVYKPELRKLLWPVFVYSYLDLVREYFTKDAETFFAKYRGLFELDHSEDVKKLSVATLPVHLNERLPKLYLDNKYRVTMTLMPFYNLIQFLESKIFEGGQALIDVVRDHLNIVTVDRATTAEKSIAAILASGQNEDELPAEDEGIPGHNPGHPLTSRHDPEADASRIRLTLGPYPQDQDLQDDVRAALQEEDAKAPRPGQPSLVDEYDARIKREPTEDAPSRDMVPLPPSLARDVSMEVQKVVEHRDRYRLEGTRTGGIGPGVSVTMYTFHNTYDR